MSKPEVIIIRGGLGGLTAGAALAKLGKKVLLLEQHYIPGGCATASFLLKPKKSLKSSSVFTLFILIVLIESCNQVKKQPAIPAVTEHSQPTNKNNKNMNTNISNNPLAAGLVRVGKEGIETGNDKVLDAYFSNDYIFHGPNGEMNLTQLKAYFTSLRNALTGFTIERMQIIVEGNMVGARNIFSGTFDKEFTQSAIGTIKPTGKPVRWEVINTFRYNDEGLLVEEWVQNDGISFLKQFGVDLLEKNKRGKSEK